MQRMIIFFGGLIGAGKSSVAKGFAEHLAVHYYDVDEHKRVIYQQDPAYQHNMEHGIPFSKETRLKVFRKVVNDFSELSKTHQHLVVDETLHNKELREYLFEGAKKYFGGYIIVWVQASEEVILNRLTNKAREGHILKDAVKMHNAFLKEFEPFDETIISCNNDGALEDTIDEINTLFDNIATCSNLARQ